MTSTHRRQFALQLSAAMLVLSLAWPLHLFTEAGFDWMTTALSIGAIAFLIAWRTKQPWWWQAIHLGFCPMAWLVAQARIDPLVFLGGFMLLLLVFRGAVSGRIPIYLSGGNAVEAVSALIGERRSRSVLDLGAGIGSLVVPLARQFPETRFVGVENAPLPWLIGRVRTLHLANVEWRLDDLWKVDLGHYDLIYAFLSPEPMPRLGARLDAALPPGSLFVSNSFEIPGRRSDFVVQAGERSLYGYSAAPPPRAA